MMHFLIKICLLLIKIGFYYYKFSTVIFLSNKIINITFKLIFSIIFKNCLDNTPIFMSENSSPIHSII